MERVIKGDGYCNHEDEALHQVMHRQLTFQFQSVNSGSGYIEDKK